MSCSVGAFIFSFKFSHSLIVATLKLKQTFLTFLIQLSVVGCPEKDATTKASVRHSAINKKTGL